MDVGRRPELKSEEFFYTEASRAADKVAFERHLDIAPQILLHLGSAPCRLVVARERLERSVPALDMKSMSARFD